MTAKWVTIPVGLPLRRQTLLLPAVMLCVFATSVVGAAESAASVVGAAVFGAPVVGAYSFCSDVQPLLTERDAIVRTFLNRREGFWRRIAAGPFDSLTSRELFAYALALCEARQNPDRLPTLLEIAERMQDREPGSPARGNFWWTFGHGKVTDYNAVEFCIHDALLMWLRHRQWMPPPSAERLRRILQHALEGCLRHRVPVDYTNIAILNAGNLILLGEVLGDQQTAHEGSRRLEAILWWTWQFGTHEYCSPTYYATNLEGLKLICQYSQSPVARRQAEALLRLLWADIALNWFAPAGRLAGPHSRSYDYLRGHGALDGHLMLAGWLDPAPTPLTDLLHAAIVDWQPPADLQRLCNARVPRTVRQSWGIAPVQSRTHLLCPDVTLGCAAASYAEARQDLPLTIDLPGNRQQVRCYFIADGRQDPYGIVRLATGAAGHQKALHLAPFWAAAQDGPDVLALCIYRPEDLDDPELIDVQSHLVLRRPDQAWLDGKPIETTPQQPGQGTRRIVIAVGKPLVLRYGTAAVGVSVLWARAQDGAEAQIGLIDDRNAAGAWRLSIEHRSGQKKTEPGMALWVRVGSGLAEEKQFQDWRCDFQRALSGRQYTVNIAADWISLAAGGQRQWLRCSAHRPWGNGGKVELWPPPSRAVLELDGKDIGRPLLAAVEPIRDYRGPSCEKPLRLPPCGGRFEAEQTLLFPAMQVQQDSSASAGRYVWQPAETAATSVPGMIVLPLQVAQSGKYRLWLRVQTGGPTADSLFVRVSTPTHWIDRTAWHLRHIKGWNWQPFSLQPTQQPDEPYLLDLPAGQCIIVLQAREPGVKIDQILLTPDADYRPQ